MSTHRIWAIPKKITLAEPEALLAFLSQGQGHFDLNSVELIEIWGLVALAALARNQRAAVESTGLSNGSRFAFGVGFNDAVLGDPPVRPGEVGRTVKVARVTDFRNLERIASEISSLMIQDSRFEDLRQTIYYVLVELLRNVLQHSKDSLGAIVAGQLNAQGPFRDEPAVQVAVADAGIGVHAALQPMHPHLTDPRQALEVSLRPHISGAFEEGLTGAPLAQNAGLGLFFITEFAKLTAGTVLLASRGAALFLKGDSNAEPHRHRLDFVGASGVGFPGTLVAFEMPIGLVDYSAMTQTIQERARERTPSRTMQRWLRFEAPPAGVQEYAVKVGSEDTAAAEEFAREVLAPALFARKPVALNFVHIPICTQSYLHSLLFAPLRLAWAQQVPIYIVNAAPAVRSSLTYLESYASSG